MIVPLAQMIDSEERDLIISDLKKNQANNVIPFFLPRRKFLHNNRFSLLFSGVSTVAARTLHGQAATSVSTQPKSLAVLSLYLPYI